MLLLSDLVDEDRLAAAKASLAELSDADLWTFTFDGVAFGAFLHVAMRLEYFGEDWRQLPNLVGVARAWLQSSLVVWAAAHGLFTRYRPAGILAISGLMPGDQALLAVARRYGVRCVFYEMGQRPGSVNLRHEQPAGFYAFPSEWAEWADVPLSVAEAARLDAMLGGRRSLGSGMTNVYSPAAGGDAARVCDRLRLQPGRPLLVAYSGATFDSSVISANDVFASQRVWLFACVAYAEAHADVDLVIRVHPVEARIYRPAGAETVGARERAADVIAARWPVLPDNVRLVDADADISSYDLMAMATVVLTYISTLSLEAAAAGKTLLTAGRSHFREVGLGWVVRRPESFADQVTALLARPEPPPHAQELARRYVYFWLLRATPQLPGLPHQRAQLVEPPCCPLPFWDAAGDAGGAAAIGDYLTGDGPFITPPAADRPRDALGPLPIRPPADPVLLVFAAGWTAEALADAVLRPCQRQRRRWQLAIVLPEAEMVPLARMWQRAEQLAGGFVSLRVLPVAGTADLDPAWAMMASAYVPPRPAESAVSGLAAAFGWPRWDQVWLAATLPTVAHV
jgi:hypothetical protein